MTLQQLRYAAGVARHGSFNLAATRLFISQPSLSAAIRELESEIGISIFERTNRGISVTSEGAEFLGYARQVIEQSDLLESRYSGEKKRRRLFSVTTQHYAFAVSAFADLIRELGADEYECTLRETRTHEIIDDVKNLRSEIGILYRSESNARVLEKVFEDGGLRFVPLFTARPHIFVRAGHELAARSSVGLSDLDRFPCLTFDQGDVNSFHFSEEIMSTLAHKRSVKVSDRATLFNLLKGLDGYTISTGILASDLSAGDIASVPLEAPEEITVGYLVHRAVGLSPTGALYVDKLAKFARSGHSPLLSPAIET